MQYQPLLKTAALVLAAGLAAPVALAQNAAPTAPTPQVMTDVAPLPASDRNSIGAVVLEDSMVIAQREHRMALQQAADRTGLASIGRNAIRATLREQTRSELAQARALEAARMRDRGAAGFEIK